MSEELKAKLGKTMLQYSNKRASFDGTTFLEDEMVKIIELLTLPEEAPATTQDDHVAEASEMADVIQARHKFEFEGREYRALTVTYGTVSDIRRKMELWLNDPLIALAETATRPVNEVESSALHNALRKSGKLVAKGVLVEEKPQADTAPMELIDVVAEVIDGVQLFSRINDWTGDRVDGLPIEICRYGKEGEAECVVIRRYPIDKGEAAALAEEVSYARARAAIAAMKGEKA